MSTSLSTSADEFTFTLEAAAERAASARGVQRAWFADDDVVADVYFFRDLVIHAEVNGTFGVPAIAALTRAKLRFAVQPSQWPRECTLMQTWAQARREAEGWRAHPSPSTNADEQTTRLSPAR